MTRQCLSPGIETIELLTAELTAWEDERNKTEAKITWHFQTEDAAKNLRGEDDILESGKCESKRGCEVP